MRRLVALGDPQAPFERVLGVLDRHGLLGPSGRLGPDVCLVSVGDHFDWGPPSARVKATTDAVALLGWLAGHDPEQVILLAGNHDLARVMELWPFRSDEAFEAAHLEAAAAYRQGRPDPALSAAFLERYPFLPDPELLARDYSCFSVEQRRAVELLVRSGRFRLAFAHRNLLVVHAGLTADDLARLGPQVPPSAEGIAAALNGLLDSRVQAWADDRPLDLAPVYRPASGPGQLAAGLLVHRPANPQVAELTPGRRYDPRGLAPVPQVIGHIRDGKCRQLLGGWATPGPPAGDGPLRSLTVDGDGVEYRPGVAPGARLVFIDGGLFHAPAEAYQLLDLDTRQPLL